MPEPPRASAPPPAAPAAAAAPAQPPTEQQKAAIRAACRSDFMAHCSGVQPGGAAALQCLQRNAARLSGACRSAVTAIGGGGAAPGAAPAAAAAPTAAPIGLIPMMRPRDALAILQICRAEAGTLCAGTPLGGGRMLNCLAANAASLSPDCYSALSAAARR
jgi:pyruvate/2-oxoglutarate dehydrogenase complex dihydrolipoamide acyltransferase (E2) component